MSRAGSEVTGYYRLDVGVDAGAAVSQNYHAGICHTGRNKVVSNVYYYCLELYQEIHLANRHADNTLSDCYGLF